MSIQPAATSTTPTLRDKPGRRRKLLGLLLACAAGSAAASAAGSASTASTASAEVWLELSEPVAASSTDAPAMQAQRKRVAAQQQRIGMRLSELGIEEVGRVQHVRNAIAVRVTPRQARLARAIPGVVRLRPTRSLHPPVTSSRPTKQGGSPAASTD